MAEESQTGSGNNKTRNRRKRRKKAKQMKQLQISNNNKNSNKTNKNKSKSKQNKNKSTPNSSKLTAEQYCEKFKKYTGKHLHNILICGYIRPNIKTINMYRLYSNMRSVRSRTNQLIVYGYIHSIFKHVSICPTEIIAIMVRYYDTYIYIPNNIVSVCSSYLLSFVKWERFTHLGLGDFLENVTQWKQVKSKAEWIHINLSEVFYRFPSIDKRIFVRKYIMEKWPWPLITTGYFNVTLNGLIVRGTPDDTHIWADTLFKDNIEHLEYILYKGKDTKIISLSNLGLCDDDIVYISHMLENICVYRRKHNKKTNLEIIDLSHNNISNKYIALLLRTVKKYVSSLKKLILAFNNITNKSISIVMKYNIYNLQINLTGCKGITMKALKKHQRGEYNDGNWIRYLYCKNKIYFGINTEPQSAIKTILKQEASKIAWYNKHWYS